MNCAEKEKEVADALTLAHMARRRYGEMAAGANTPNQSAAGGYLSLPLGWYMLVSGGPDVHTLREPLEKLRR
ncbi:MAG: hypothetical protein R3E67_03445 [Pseudomonadales bacterium]